MGGEGIWPTAPCTLGEPEGHNLHSCNSFQWFEAKAVHTAVPKVKRRPVHNGICAHTSTAHTHTHPRASIGAIEDTSKTHGQHTPRAQWVRTNDGTNTYRCSYNGGEDY